MRSGADPCLRLILARLEHTAGRRDLGPHAPPGDEGAGERGIGEVDRDRVIEHPAHPGWRSSPGAQWDWLREAAEAVERMRTQNKPEPPKTNWAIGSMQWEEEQRKRREADRAAAAAEDKILLAKLAAASAAEKS